MAGVSTSDFMAEINRILGLPRREERLAAALSYQASLDSGGLAPFALFVFGQVYHRCGQLQMVRELALDLLSRFPDRDDAGDFAVRLSQEPLILHDMIDERFVESLQAPARRRLLRDPADVAAAAAVLVYLVKARREKAASRLTRRFVAHAPADKIAGDVVAQRIALYDPAFDYRDEAWNGPSPGGRVTWEGARVRPGQKPIILFSGDDRYWQAFGPGILRSMARHAPNIPVHVHLVDPSPGTLEALLEVSREGPLRLGFSHETLSAQSRASLVAVNQLRTYFACARFLALPEILTRYDCPLFVLDMDMRLRRPLRRLHALLEGADAATITDPGRNPWHRAAAGMVWVAPTAHGRTYADFVARYIRAQFTRRSAYWTVDQVVLDVANAKLIRDGGRFHAISFAEAQRHVAFAGLFIGEMTIAEKISHLDRMD